MRSVLNPCLVRHAHADVDHLGAEWGILIGDVSIELPPRFATILRVYMTATSCLNDILRVVRYLQVNHRPFINVRYRF